MNLTIIKSVRTNNFKDEAIMQKITDMWKEASSVFKNQDEVTYGLYHDYESDYKGDYTLSVAKESSDNASTIKIPNPSKYEIFKVDISDENGILSTWKQIWEREEKEDLKRAYSFDFEKYYPNGQIEIHIATKQFTMLIKLTDARAEQGVVDAAPPIVYCVNEQVALTKQLKNLLFIEIMN